MWALLTFHDKMLLVPLKFATVTSESRFNGLVVMISVSHELAHASTEGLQFDPGLNHFLSNSLVG